MNLCWIYELTFGHVTNDPTLIIRSSSAGSGSVNIRNQSYRHCQTGRQVVKKASLHTHNRVRGHMLKESTVSDLLIDLKERVPHVTAPSNRCKKTLDQSWPNTVGKSSKSRITCTRHSIVRQYPRALAIDPHFEVLREFMLQPLLHSRQKKVPWKYPINMFAFDPEIVSCLSSLSIFSALLTISDRDW